MGNRSTAVGRLWRRDPDAARALVIATIRRCRGDLPRAALELGYKDKVILYRWMWREALWSEVDRIRAERDATPPANPLARMGAALARSGRP